MEGLEYAILPLAHLLTHVPYPMLPGRDACSGGDGGGGFSCRIGQLEFVDGLIDSSVSGGGAERGERRGGEGKIRTV